MTCIVGLETKNSVIIGGDSAGLSGWRLTIRADEKVFNNGPYVMGFCGSFRMGQVLRYSFKAPVPSEKEEQDIMRFMSTIFVNAVRTALKKSGYAKLKDSVESGGTFLVGYKNKLFMIGGDYQVGRAISGFNSIGCGDELALGALHILKSIKGSNGSDKVVVALEAAAAHNAGVSGPFRVVESKIEI